jgi:abortive infection bacteriophage resistance protein
MSVTYGPHWYLEKRLFNTTSKNQKRNYKHDELIKSIGFVMKRQHKEVFLEYYQFKYCDPKDLPPSWMVTEILTIGDLSNIFDKLRERKDQNIIAKAFNIDSEVLRSWFHSISYTRNLCAHHSRLWNRDLRITPTIPNNPHLLPRWIKQPRLLNSRIYFSLVVIEYLLQEVNPESTWHWRLKHLMEKYPKIAKASMGMPDDWFSDEFWRFQSEPPIFHN